MSSIVVYDTTLRDGMQGEGMSLFAEEKVRVAHLLDDLAVGDGTRGPVTTEIQAIFEDALHGRSARYSKWLDKVPAAVT